MECDEYRRAGHPRGQPAVATAPGWPLAAKSAVADSDERGEWKDPGRI